MDFVKSPSSKISLDWKHIHIFNGIFVCAQFKNETIIIYQIFYSA